MFQLEVLKLKKVVLKRIPTPSNFEIKTLLGFLTGKTMGGSGLGAHQDFIDVG